MSRESPPILPNERLRVPQRGERMLVVCPHPDDETLTTGGLLAAATRRGAEVTVTYLTSGDGFPLAAALHFGRPSNRDTMRALASTREGEALAALGCLGVAPEQVRFLRFPDRGIAPLWLEPWRSGTPFRSRYSGRDRTEGSGRPYCGEALLSDLDTLLDEIKPHYVFGPDPADDHPDHWAGACFVTAAVERFRRRGGGSPECLTGLVHRGNWPAPMRPGAELPLAPPRDLLPLDVTWCSHHLDEATLTAKREALHQHRTQLPLVGRFLRSFLRPGELFSRWPVPQLGLKRTVTLLDPVRDRFGRAWCAGVDIAALELHRHEGGIRITVRLRGRPQPWARYVLSWCCVPTEGRPLESRRAWFEGAALRAGAPFTVEIDHADPTGTVLLGAEVWGRELLLDRTPWRTVRAARI